MKFVGAASTPVGVLEGPLAGKTNYLLGEDPSRYVTNVPHFERVRYHDLYPGVDLVYYGRQHELEFDLIAAPRADLSRIQLQFEGIRSLEINEKGDLLVATNSGELIQHLPRVVQWFDGNERSLAAHYVKVASNSVSIVVPTYDRTRPLVIDPVLTYSTFLGGASNDYASSVAIDTSGNAYVAGYTSSTNFPTVNAFDRSVGSGDTDVFVTKINATGTAILYSTYLGGSRSIDLATGIAVDAAGNAYVTGTTTGSDFPTTSGAYQTGTTGGGSFVTKVGTAGNTLVYSTYLLNGSAKGIAVDPSGSALVTGSATSRFTTTAGALQRQMNGSTTNAFVIRLNATGTAASYATFLGGSGTDVANAIVADSAGNAYIGGSTTSSDFPQANGAQTALGGGKDGFVAKIAPSGNSLLYSTYLGGNQSDSVNAIAIDHNGNAYVGGETFSDNFPVSVFALQFERTGQFLLNSKQGVGFVAKLNATGSGLLYSTFLGGDICISYCTYFQPPPETPGDAVYGIAVDGQGHAYVTGIARSYSFPLVDSLLNQKQSDTQDSLFVAKVAQAGNALLYSSLIRTTTATSGSTPTGFPYDGGKGVAVDANGAAFVVSEGASGYPTTSGAVQTANAGATDATLLKLTNPMSAMTLDITPRTSVAGQSARLSATVTGGGSTGTVKFTFYSQGFNQSTSVPLSNGTATTTMTLPAGLHAVSAIYRNGTNIGDTPLLFQVANPPTVCN